MTDQTTLTQDAERAFREAENFCWRTNTGIVAPEHLLAGCLRVLNAAGFPGLPADERVEQALLMAQGMSEDALTQNVMFGSAAREAVNFTARLVREAGGGEIDTLTLAYGVIRSGEVGPMFFSALGTKRRSCWRRSRPPANSRPERNRDRQGADRTQARQPEREERCKARLGRSAAPSNRSGPFSHGCRLTAQTQGSDGRMVRFGRTTIIFAATGALVATAFFVVVAIKASGGEPESLPREVSPEEVSAALSALRADATFQQLTADREWKVVEQVPNMRDGRRMGVGLIVDLSSPVDSAGPWKQNRCQGTETYEFSFPYRGVSTLGAAFNGDGALIGLQPLPSPSLAFDDADIESQPPLPPCPRGREDKEN